MKLLFVLEGEQKKSVGFLPYKFSKRHSVLFRTLSENSFDKVTVNEFLDADKIFVTQEFHKSILSYLVYPHKKEIINLKINPLTYGKELEFTLNQKLKLYL